MIGCSDDSTEFELSPTDEPLVAERPDVEPVLQVNGHSLKPFYAEWVTPDGEPDLGDITMLPPADVIRISLIDDVDTYRLMEVRFYDQRPSDTASMVALAECSNGHIAPNPLFDIEPDTAIGPIRLLDCAMDRRDTRLTVDVGALARRCSMLYAVVPVIWWPTEEEWEPGGMWGPSDAAAWPYKEFATASWAFAMRPACDP